MDVASQLSGQGQGSPPSAPAPAAGWRGSRRRWRWLVLASLVLAVTVVIMLAVMAGTYQPLVPGSIGGYSIAGLPSGSGIRYVNTFGDSTGDLYIPPQKGVFTVLVSIANSGPEAVTIEAVRVGNPQQSWPLVQAGAVRYELPSGSASRPLKDYRLAASGRPGSQVVIGISVSTASHCAVKNHGWVHIESVLVEERFLIFTHWVSIPLMNPLILRPPGGTPGNPGAACAT